jgi:hypothetical protein
MTVQMIADELQIGNGWIFHQDSAPSHNALIVLEFLAHNSVTATDHPSYSLDLAPCNFVISKVQLVLHGRNLRVVAMITAELITLLKGLKEDDFQGCFNRRKLRWDKCIACEGDKNDVPNDT